MHFRILHNANFLKSQNTYKCGDPLYYQSPVHILYLSSTSLYYCTKLAFTLNRKPKVFISIGWAEPSNIGIIFFQWISKGIFSKKYNKFENGFMEKARRKKNVLMRKKKLAWDKWCVSYYSKLLGLEICKLVQLCDSVLFDREFIF